MVYKIELRAQSFEFESWEKARDKVRELLDAGLWFFTLDEIKEEKKEIAPIDSEKGIKQRDQAREKMLKKAKKEERLKNSVQKIKPIMIDPKIKPGTPKKFTPEVDKYIITHADVSNEDIANSLKRLFDVETTPGSVGNRKSILKSAKPTKEKVDMRTLSKYPDEMKEFVKSRMETTTNQDITDLINEKWDLGLTKDRLKSFMKYNKLKRKFIIRSPRRTSTELEKEGRPKKYTDEVLQFLKDNINKFKNKELREELEKRFNIKVTQSSLDSILSQKGIKRDIQPDVEPEIEDFILKSKITDAYILRDQIIEKLGKNITTRKIINIMNKRNEEPEKKSELSEDEKKLIKQKDLFDEDIDELDLDN